MERYEEDLYDVSTYTDIELYEFLDLNNPSDRELEAKIIFMIEKYDKLNNKKLTNFFIDIYNHFFEDDEDDEEEEYEEYEIQNDMKIVENFDSKINTQSVTSVPISTIKNNTPINSQNNDISSKDKTVLVSQRDYVNDSQLNPLLQQTIKRLINVESRYRDDKTSLSTDFTFNLSTPLKNVVSLKLYSIQIPYSWFTIDNNFGSNFFYLKGNKPGIMNNPNQYIMIDVSSGNYDAKDLIDTINQSIKKKKVIYSDVSFGETSIDYNSATTFSTINIDIKKQYNQNSYQLKFDDLYLTSPYAINDIDRSKNLASFLGFNSTNYYLNVLKSNLLPFFIDNKDSTNPDNLLNFTLYSSNNYFTIIQYIYEYDSDNVLIDYNPNSIIDFSFNIYFSLSISTSRVQNEYSKNTLYNDLLSQINNSPYLSNESYINRINLTDTSNSIFELKIKLNRKTTNNISNSRIIIQFPNEIDQNAKNIWTGSNSCFNFKNSINQLNTIISDTYAVDQSSNIYDIPNGSLQILLTCSAENYVSKYNDITITVPNSPYNQPYTTKQFIDALNTGIYNATQITPFLNGSNYIGYNYIYQYENYTNIFPLYSTAFLDYNDYFNLFLKIYKLFNEKLFRIDLNNTFLSNNLFSNIKTSFNSSINDTDYYYNNSQNIDYFVNINTSINNGKLFVNTGNIPIINPNYNRLYISFVDPVSNKFFGDPLNPLQITKIDKYYNDVNNNWIINGKSYYITENTYNVRSKIFSIPLDNCLNIPSNEIYVYTSNFKTSMPIQISKSYVTIPSNINNIYSNGIISGNYKIKSNISDDISINGKNWYIDASNWKVNKDNSWTIYGNSFINDTFWNLNNNFTFYSNNSNSNNFIKNSLFTISGNLLEISGNNFDLISNNFNIYCNDSKYPFTINGNEILKTKDNYLINSINMQITTTKTSPLISKPRTSVQKPKNNYITLSDNNIQINSSNIIIKNNQDNFSIIGNTTLLNDFTINSSFINIIDNSYTIISNFISYNNKLEYSNNKLFLSLDSSIDISGNININSVVNYSLLNITTRNNYTLNGNILNANTKDNFRLYCSKLNVSDSFIDKSLNINGKSFYINGVYNIITSDSDITFFGNTQITSFSSSLLIYNTKVDDTNKIFSWEIQCNILDNKYNYYEILGDDNINKITCKELIIPNNISNSILIDPKPSGRKTFFTNTTFYLVNSISSYLINNQSLSVIPLGIIDLNLNNFLLYFDRNYLSLNVDDNSCIFDVSSINFNNNILKFYSNNYSSYKNDISINYLNGFIITGTDLNINSILSLRYSDISNNTISNYNNFPVINTTSKLSNSIININVTNSRIIYTIKNNDINESIILDYTGLISNKITITGREMQINGNFVIINNDFTLNGNNIYYNNNSIIFNYNNNNSKIILNNIDNNIKSYSNFFTISTDKPHTYKFNNNNANSGNNIYFKNSDINFRSSIYKLSGNISNIFLTSDNNVTVNAIDISSNIFGNTNILKEIYGDILNIKPTNSYNNIEIHGNLYNLNNNLFNIIGNLNLNNNFDVSYSTNYFNNYNLLTTSKSFNIKSINNNLTISGENLFVNGGTDWNIQGNLLTVNYNSDNSWNIIGSNLNFNNTKFYIYENDFTLPNSNFYISENSNIYIEDSSYVSVKDGFIQTPTINNIYNDSNNYDLVNKSKTTTYYNYYTNNSFNKNIINDISFVKIDNIITTKFDNNDNLLTKDIDYNLLITDDLIVNDHKINISIGENSNIYYNNSIEKYVINSSKINVLSNNFNINNTGLLDYFFVTKEINYPLNISINNIDISINFVSTDIKYLPPINIIGSFILNNDNYIIPNNGDILTVYPLFNSYELFEGGGGFGNETNNKGYRLYNNTGRDIIVNNIVDLQKNINDLFTNFIDENNEHIFNGSNITITLKDYTFNEIKTTYINSILNIKINKLLLCKDYNIQFVNINDNGNIQRIWDNNLNLNSSLINKPYPIYNNNNVPFIDTTAININEVIIKGDSELSSNYIKFINNNGYFKLLAYDDGTVGNDIYIDISNVDINGDYINYSINTLLIALNKSIKNYNNKNIDIKGTNFSIIYLNNKIYVRIDINVNLIFSSNDYNLVFYDSISFLKCYNNSSTSRNTTWDTTLGWILGFQSKTEYLLSENSTGNNIFVSGDCGVLTNAINSVYLCLNEYTQNYLNDGLVTINSPENNISLPSYANRTNILCDPLSEKLVYSDVYAKDFKKLTEKEIYTITQIANTNNSNSSNLTNQINSKYFSSGPSINDIYAIIPLKVSGTRPGSIYTEFGGTLQNNERVYFGPVNISKMSIKLITDKGNVLDLNGSNWSFTLLCEQLYKQASKNK